VQKSEGVRRQKPDDDKTRHFGKGQNETMLDLSACTFALQLVLADWKHTPHVNPVMSDRITVTVRE